MKRIITFSVILMAICFTVVGVIKDQNKNATYDVSTGLYVIANSDEMAKSALVNQSIKFSADDFERYLNLSEIGSITIVSVPDVSDGCLCVGNVLVNAGQTISRENLDLLNYRAGNNGAKSAVFTFRVGDSEYEMKCNMYFLNYENLAPTFDNEDEKIFSVSTHQTVSVWGKLSAYDSDGDKLKYEIVTYAKNGVITLDKGTGEYFYTPIGAYFGTDYFEYVAVDEYGNYSRSARVDIKVEKLKGDAVYTDMQGHRAHHAALVMREMGIMNGTTIGENTYFMPDKSVSRIDFLVMLMHSIGVSSVENVLDTGFDDDAQIPASMKGYVRRARDMGIIVGKVNSDGEYLFDPNSPITRAEAALLVNNIVNGKMPTIKPTFADKDEIPAWAHDAIYSLYDMGILNTDEGSISPKAEITRAQVAQMLCAIMDYIK